MIEKDLVFSAVSAGTSALNGEGGDRTSFGTYQNTQKLLVWQSVTPDFFMSFEDEKKFDDRIIEPATLSRGQKVEGY